MIEKVSLFDMANNVEEDTTYTTKTSVPQYEPHNECPSIYSLCDTRKYEKLINDINSANISDEDKEFLKMAATRHVVFNYSKIADYYCYASKEVQQLMEDSALVLIDIDDAIVKVEISSQLFDFFPHIVIRFRMEKSLKILFRRRGSEDFHIDRTISLS